MSLPAFPLSPWRKAQSLHLQFGSTPHLPEEAVIGRSDHNYCQLRQPGELRQYATRLVFGGISLALLTGWLSRV